MSALRPASALLVLALLGGCALGLGGPPLISGASVADAQAANAMPQWPGSLPRGALGLPSGPNSEAPDYVAARFGAGAGPSYY